MTLPTTYIGVLIMSLLAMVCWGGWLNTRKIGNWRFELYYADFAIGLLAIVSLLALTLGETGTGLSFRDNLLVTGRRQLAYAFVAGGVFNLGNLLLVGAVSVAGVAVSYPIAAGIGLIVGIVWSIVLGTDSSVTILVAGAIVLLIGILINVRGHGLLAKVMDATVARNWKSKHRRPPKTGLKAIWLGIASGVILGCSYPLTTMSTATELGLRPYSVAFLFGVGVLCSTPVFVLLFMNVPVKGKPLPLTAYLKGSVLQHLYGLAGGAIWGLGMVAFLAATVELDGERLIDTAGIAIIAASIPAGGLCGLFCWKEFDEVPPPGRRTMLAAALVLAVGLGLIAYAAGSA